MDINKLKEKAAAEAVKKIESGMVLGLGTGSTANFAIRQISRLLKEGSLRDVVGIPSSNQTQELARELGIPLMTFEQKSEIDLNIDGADEVDPDLNLIKGGGGALLREKIIAQASKRNIIVVDEQKLSDKLGTKWAVPVQIMEFAYSPIAKYIEGLGAKVNLRKNQDRKIFKTDQGNIIIDCNFGQIENVAELDQALNIKAGIVEHGLFIGIADEVIVGRADTVEHLTK
ncbi:MAG: ribose 5-phosphate isomerase A [Candidatus Dadabacteria bacterium]|nr:ribose 5-phosphate isomerase A [Candidatus Dadabacteria bacterium]NIS09794.1 ribose 5-phosphate isomerase A [Candidatus Dadabacteria bacterium]NIV41150.1 ribose 5-phosphate isomerase A [Candidatus Dadabacteria bacterium]NIX16235.1 ribose 5-phosphate isomerase A [Candidatus Dadabacteria bacterium]NIY22855.1 ribose 5-phosphate isomerase A [Candidatus Dadabacteria bacterium]